MEYTACQKRLPCEDMSDHIDWPYRDNSDDLGPARGILNGLIIEMVAAVFVLVVIAAI